MTISRKTPGHRVGLDADKVANEALRLSESQGINGWTMRELAAHLTIAPSVLYHYYPTRDDLVNAVIDRIGKLIELPSFNLDWKDWFFEFALNLRRVLLRYNGVADQLMIGRFTHSMIPLLDGALTKLNEAGFGDMTRLAFPIFINVTLGAISGKDHRSDKERHFPHDLNEMINSLHPLSQNSSNAQYLFKEFLEPLALQEKSKTSNGLSDRYFELAITSILNGLESTLLPLACK